MYFLTICTQNRHNYFGEIVSNGGRDAMHGVSTNPALHDNPTNAILHPTEIGKIAFSEWFKTPELRPDMNLELGEFVMMPNHIHGIIMICENEFNRLDTMYGVSTEYKNQFVPQSKNLASIIRGYKSAVTNYARKNNIEFEWQTRFHDRIIRSMDEYCRISNYIINNPTKLLEGY